ncbi:MAG: transglutaminase family protein, partial [Desulfuromonadales bacterium]|nr:transglutaminase family protein [Desulfuromonadales bacterium]
MVLPTADDLQESSAVERSQEIVELARSLGWNPVRMYEWVVNNIETEWYWGVMKGARQTLLQGRGNDADQAALLVALMRASGYPARFIKGKVGLFPTVETGLQRLGLSNIAELMQLLQKAGIPYEPVMAGGRVANVAFEHLWCEVYVPYSNYRGSVIDAEGKSWVPLDTSLKPMTSVFTSPKFSVDDFDYASVATQYLSARQSVSPFSFLQAQLALHLNTPDFDFGDVLPHITTTVFKLDLLPASTQFKEHAVTGEFSVLPPELLPIAQVTATDMNGLQLYTLDLPIYRLIDQPLALDADPETTADQKLAAEYGGFETTPTYLLNLRPLLRLGSERVAVAGSGLAMGDHYRLRLRLISSAGATETETVQVVGGLAAIAIDSGESMTTVDSSGLAAVDLMYAAARKYNASWRNAEDLLAQLLQLPLVRPLPAVTIVGSSYNISWLDNRPYAMQWEGLFMDAAIRVTEPVTEPTAISRTFMRLSGLQGSWLEAATLFEDFQVPAIATADLFGRAIEAGIEVWSIDSSNLDTALAQLPFADNVKTDIRNAANQGWSVSIPTQNINYLAWNGIGYIKENPQSGEAGYMLTGGLAGAQTAEWADDYREQFAFARSEPPNLDPLAAADIVFIPTGDRQNGIVGQPVAKPISVLVVDLKGRPVKGALVTFRSMVGGGSFNPQVQNPVETDARGIASIVPILGTSTAVNANFALDEKGLSLYRSGAGQGEVYSTRISINTFTAQVESSFGTLSIGEEFKLNAYPDKLDHLKKIFVNSAKGMVNSYTGTFLFQAVDQYENPVSNVEMVYEALAPEPATARPLPTEQEGLRNLTLFDPLPCKIYSPNHGEWPSSKSVTVLSGHVGAYAAGFFGNTVDTLYTIKVSALGSSSVPPLEFTMSTFGTTFQGEYYPTQLQVSRIANIDNHGRTLDAVNIGETLKIPLTTAVELLVPVYKMEKQATQCTKELSDGSVESYDCWDIVWKGIVNTEKVVDGHVDYKIVPKGAGGSLGATVNNNDGTYAAKFTAPSTPRLNHIEAVGEVTLKVPEVFVDSTTNKMVLSGYRSKDLPLRTVTLESGNEALFDVETEELIEGVSSSTIDFGIYGVEVTPIITPDVTLLDQFEIVVGQTEYGARA